MHRTGAGGAPGHGRSRALQRVASRATAGEPAVVERDYAGEPPRPPRPPVGRGGGLRLVRVLDVDPDLGAVLPAADRVEARRELVARAVWCAPGRWVLPVPRNAAAGWIGVLIVDGMVSRTLTVSGRRSTELLGPGDLTRP